MYGSTQCGHRPSFARFSSAAALLILVISSANARAQEAMPTAREVVDRFVETTGIGEKLAECQSFHATGTVSMPAQGMHGTLSIHSKAPDFFALTIELPGFGKIRMGYDGEVAWSMDPASGPQLAEDEALSQIRDQANYYALLYREEDLQSMELSGEQEFAGTAAFRIDIVSRHGSESSLYFSVESGLLIGTESLQYTAMGAIPITAIIGEYRDFAGVMMPTHTEQSIMGMTQILDTTDVSFEPFDDAAFELPPAVAALVESE